jgi:tetratricopeptide (TPR) repeat protein
MKMLIITMLFFFASIAFANEREGSGLVSLTEQTKTRIDPIDGRTYTIAVPTRYTRAAPNTPLPKERRNEVDDYLKKGEEFQSSGNFDAAVYYYKKALKVQPQSKAALKRMGMYYYDMGMSETATQPEALNNSMHYLQRVLKLEPDAETLYYIGKIMLALHDYDNANITCRKLFEIDQKLGKSLALDITSYKKPEVFRYDPTSKINMAVEKKEAQQREAERAMWAAQAAIEARRPRVVINEAPPIVQTQRARPDAYEVYRTLVGEDHRVKTNSFLPKRIPTGGWADSSGHVTLY